MARRNTIPLLVRMGLLAILAVCIDDANSSPVGAGEISDSSIFLAIQKYQCFREYWGGFTSARHVLPVTFKKDGQIAYVRVEGFDDALSRAHMVRFMSVYTAHGRSWVGSNEGFNMQIPGRSTKYQEDQEQFSGPKIKTARLQLLSNCTPESDSEPNLRHRIFRAIESTMSHQLSLFNKLAGRHFPQKSQIVIGDFDLDYPSTFVLIKNTNEVWNVSLYDSVHPLSDADLNAGWFPSQQIYDPGETSALQDKIIKYGTVRDIVLGD
jgi:hypothetical protein